MAISVRQTVLEVDVSRLDVAVAGLTGAPRTVVRGMIDRGCVHLDGVVCDQPAQPVAKGATLLVRFDPETRYKAKVKPRADAGFTVAFEDKYLIVVEKRPGLLTVPTVRRETDTLVDRVGRYWSGGQQRITQPAHLVHRLDRDTSGVLVFGRTAEIAAALKDQFAARKPEREYIAIVAGEVRGQDATFRSFLATDEDLDQYSTTAPGQGKLAVTHASVRDRLRGATCLRVRLETGRRNQIRVHLSEAGHPVLGDARYRPDEARHPQWPPHRLALHALTLGFVHPVTGKPVRVTSQMPVEFERFLKLTRR